MRQILKRCRKNDTGVAMIEFGLVLPVLVLLIFGAIELVRYILIIQKVNNAAFILTDQVAQLNPASLPATATYGSEANLLNVQRIAGQLPQVMSPFSPTGASLTFGSFQNGGTMDGVNNNKMRWMVFAAWGVGFSGPVSLSGAGPFGSAGACPSTVTGLAGATCYAYLRNNSGAPNSCWDATFPAPYNTILAGNPMVGTGGNGLPTTYKDNFIMGELRFPYTPFLTALLSGLTNGGFAMGNTTIVRHIFLHPREDDLRDLPNPPAYSSSTGTTANLASEGLACAGWGS